MNSDQAVAAMKRLVYERNKGNLTTADYRLLRARLLDGLVGMSNSAIDVDPTRPRLRATSGFASNGKLPTRFAAWRFAVAVALVLGLIAAICWKAF